MLPAPYYTLINTTKGGDPAVIVVNSSLRDCEQRTPFAWHLEISIACRHLSGSGMPSTEEAPSLLLIEQTIEASLQRMENAVFLARITCRGVRSLLYRVIDPEIADRELQRLVNEGLPLRGWDYLMEKDTDWRLAHPLLDLVGMNLTRN